MEKVIERYLLLGLVSFFAIWLGASVLSYCTHFGETISVKIQTSAQ